jgi:hypothetical protein
MRKLLLLATLLASLNACKQGPEVTVCLLDVTNSQLACSDPDNNVLFIPFAQADGYIAMAPEDFQKILDYMANKCR